MAFYAVLFMVRRRHVSEKIEAGKKFGLFKPWKMNWGVEAYEELVDYVAYVSGHYFTSYLRKYGED